MKASVNKKNNTVEYGLELNNDDFLEVEIDIDFDFETRYIKPPKTKEISEFNLKYSEAKKLAQNIKLNKKSRYFVLINGSFIFGDFIEALILSNKLTVEELTISTLSLSENNVDSLNGLMNEKCVNKLNLIISDYFYSHERFNLTPYIYKMLDIGNRFQLAVAGTHTKICLIKTYCGKKIIIHGSANLRSSSNIEQIVVEENESLWDFNNDYMNKIIDKYKTINKGVRGKKLWTAINK